MALSSEQRKQLLHDLLLVREFEERVGELFLRGETAGTMLHLSIGEEAVAVGVARMMQEGDYMTTPHRGHGMFIARGAHLGRMMAEICGKATGYCRGKGGSMHIADIELGHLGANAIVGGGISIATGAGLSSVLTGSNKAAVAFFGDGALQQGVLYESMNIAALWNLPVLYVCVNNQYGMGTRLDQASKRLDFVERAQTFGLQAEQVDGMDVEAVAEAAARLLSSAREGRGPAFLIGDCYRFYGHARRDPSPYRDSEEEAVWRAKDPLRRMEQRLLDDGTLTAETLAALRDDVRSVIDAAVDFSRQSPAPSLNSMLEDVYAEQATADEAEPAAPSAPTTVSAMTAPRCRPNTKGPSQVQERGHRVSGPGYIHRGEGGRSDGHVSEPPNRPPGAERERSLMATMAYRDALQEALQEEMRRDERVFIMGEEVGRYGGAYAVTRGLLAQFGPERVRDTPISEEAIVGCGVGAAMTGTRPIVELMYVDFAGLAMDAIVNQMAKIRYMFGGRATVPMVLRTQGGTGRSSAAQHSQSLEAWFMHVPGLRIVMPATPADAKGLIKTAIRSPDPVIFIEHKALYATKGNVPEGEWLVPFGQVHRVRTGSDLTIVTYSRMVLYALEAAERLAEEAGIDVEVLDLRTLNPLDVGGIVASVRKTRRAIVVEEDCKTAGVGAEIATLIMEHAFDVLVAPVTRVAGLDVPIPCAPMLERAAIPSVDDIVRHVQQALRGQQHVE